MKQPSKIVSFHGTTLGALRTTGAVACIPAGPSPLLFDAVVGFGLQSRPDLLFLTALAERSAEINLGPGSVANPLLALVATPLPDGRSITLHDPATGRYLAAPPVQAADRLAGVTASRDRADAWEHFSLAPLPAEAGTPAVATLAAAVGVLFEEGLDVGSVVRCIQGASGAEAGWALNAVVPLLSRNALGALADQLLRTPELLERLKAIFPGNAWATAGLPDLVGWLSGRGTPPALAPEPPHAPAVPTKPSLMPRWVRGFSRDARPQPQGATADPAAAYAVSDKAVSATAGPAEPRRSMIRIGTDLDELALGADSGSFIAGGRFMSFPQACTSLARQKVEPRRRACIVMCARNEGIYLPEWIAYHRAIGFEHFFIYSNNNDDGSDALLAALARANVITWIDNEMAPGVRSQYKAYGHAFGILPEVLDFEWSLIVDADEFFVPNPDRFTTVSEFLFWQEKCQVDAIALNWRFLASNNEVSCLDQLMTERNTRFVGNPLIGDGFRLIKTIFRPRCMLRSRSHTPVCDERSSFTYRLSTGELHLYQSSPPGFHADAGFSDRVNTDNACIYHYYYKSASEWMWKSSRNRGDSPVRSGLPDRFFTEDWIKDFMRQNDEPDQEVENRLGVYRARIQQELAWLEGLPGIAEAVHGVREAYTVRLAELKTIVRSSPILERPSELSRRFLTLAGVL